ncbi:MAG: DsrE family protein [bacterium]
MSEKRPPLGILLLAGGQERAHYALVMASGAAALGRDVVLFATNGGCRLLLADSPLLQDSREAYLAQRGVAGVGTLLSAIAALGVRRMVCEAGLKAEDLGAAPLAPGVERAGVASFLAAVGAGQMISL